MTVENRSIDRRTIVKGVAWSTPVLAAAMATPAFAASPPACEVDLVIERKNCTLVGAGRPYFNVKNHGNCEIPAGTVLSLTSGTGFGFRLELGILTESPGLEVRLLQDGKAAEITLSEPLAPGESRTIQFLPRSVIDFGINRNATLALVSLPEGVTDSNPNNNSERMSWTGSSIAGFGIYTCSG